jgi:hypothetical protein
MDTARAYLNGFIGRWADLRLRSARSCQPYSTTLAARIRYVKLFESARCEVILLGKGGDEAPIAGA